MWVIQGQPKHDENGNNLLALPAFYWYLRQYPNFAPSFFSFISNLCLLSLPPLPPCFPDCLQKQLNRQREGGHNTAMSHLHYSISFSSMDSACSQPAMFKHSNWVQHAGNSVLFPACYTQSLYTGADWKQTGSRKMKIRGHFGSPFLLLMWPCLKGEGGRGSCLNSGRNAGNK